MNWLTTDGPSHDGPSKIVHTVRGNERGPDPQGRCIRCGATPVSGWYDEYDHRDGGTECTA